MKFTVPLVLGANRRPIGLFSAQTNSGTLVMIFSTPAIWDRFASAAAPALRRRGQFLGSSEMEADVLEDLVDQLLEIDPSLADADFVPDSAPIVKDVIAFFQNQR